MATLSAHHLRLGHIARRQWIRLSHIARRQLINRLQARPSHACSRSRQAFLGSALLVACLLWLPMAGLAAGGPAAASPVAPAPVLTPAQTDRLRHLSEELRCLVCQNQSLADSNADLAVDLRNQVRDMVAQNLDDASIKRYLVDRYGDFVLFKPPVQGNTWLLWVGPFALLAVGLWIWSRLGRRPVGAAAGGALDADPTSLRPGATQAAGAPAGRPPFSDAAAHRSVDLAAARRLLDDPEP